MDEIVRQALAKWPHVPHCYGWLGLDARGGWHMRDEQAQAAGDFPRSRGAPLRHEKLVGFIHRNYDRDPAGCWYFQNGPQRVYVELEAAPWVWRIQASGEVLSHTGRSARVRASGVDEAGRLYLDTDIGLGLVHSLDMALAAEAVESGRWLPQEWAASDLPRRFGFVRSPQAFHKKGA